MRVQMIVQFNSPTMEQAEGLRQGLVNALTEGAVEGAVVGQVVEVPVEVIVHTDGGCEPGGFGAWAYTIQMPDGGYHEAVGTEVETTNNRMEMTALKEALTVLELGQTIRVFSDSEYLIKGLTTWSRNWVRNGWKNASGKAVKNQDLWEPLLALYQLHSIELCWVKGHNGHAGNERCDALCTEAIKAAHKELLKDVPLFNADGAPL